MLAELWIDANGGANVSGAANASEAASASGATNANGRLINPVQQLPSRAPAEVVQSERWLRLPARLTPAEFGSSDDLQRPSKDTRSGSRLSPEARPRPPVFQRSEGAPTSGSDSSEQWLAFPRQSAEFIGIKQFLAELAGTQPRDANSDRWSEMATH